MSVIERVIEPKPRDLGDGFSVRRALPTAARRAVGPFVFLDHMGPAHFPPGAGLDVRPHPHIGLATVTYLFEGEIMHRDSLGVVQPITPGEVNWMNAGRGIVHSERTAPERRDGASPIHGVQAWVALPIDKEEMAPSFYHHPAASLPVWETGGARVTLIAGAAYGRISPVEVFWPIFYADAVLPAGAELPLPDNHEERAFYVVSGAVAVAGQPVLEQSLAVIAPGAQASILAVEDARVMLLGGAPLEAPRHMWWNFVSHSAERIEQAKADWRAGAFPPVPGETEFIPLPDR